MEEQTKQAPASPQQKTRTTSLLTGLVLSLVLLVIINLVSFFLYTRLDFSKGRIHTLSRTSKNIVRELKDNLVVKVYFSHNLPADYSLLATYCKDLLSEYKTSSRGRFRYEFVSPANDEEFRAETQRNQIYPQKVMILENDQQSIREIFLGLTFEYKGNRETLNLSRGTEGRMEYEITALVRRLAKAKLPKIVVFEDSLYSPRLYQFFEHHTAQNYEVESTDLTKTYYSSKVMIFTGVVDSLSRTQLFALDQYIMHGGKVLFLQDRVAGLIQYNQAEELNSNVYKLLEHYGVVIKPNLVMDQNCLPIKLSQRSGIFIVDVPVLYPLVPLMQGNKNHQISRGLSDMMMYLSSEINTISPNKDLTITPLLQTSQNSGVLTGPFFDITPANFIGHKAAGYLILKNLTVAALATGKMRSYFADSLFVKDNPGFKPETENGEIIVVADSDIARDFATEVTETNIMFILNATDFLLGDTSLIPVRSRTLTSSPLDISRWLSRKNLTPERMTALEPVVKNAVKLINLLLPSGLLILLGIIIHIRFKTYRRSIKDRFNLPAFTKQYKDTERPES